MLTNRTCYTKGSFVLTILKENVARIWDSFFLLILYFIYKVVRLKISRFYFELYIYLLLLYCSYIFFSRFLPSLH